MTGNSWVTFDCYGTLIDWERGIADALLPLLPKRVDAKALTARYAAIEAELEAGSYRRYRDVLDTAGRYLLAECGVEAPAGRALLSESLAQWKPFPETRQALLAVRNRGYRIAMLTNVDRDLFGASILQMGFEPDLVVTADEVQSYKPQAGHWQRFLALTGADARQTVHVASSLYHDIRPASAMGFRTVFVNRKDEELLGAFPRKVLADLRLVPDAVDALVQPERPMPRLLAM